MGSLRTSASSSAGPSPSLRLSAPDGGGECPGSDLAIGMTAPPEPVLVSNYLTYSIAVTNNGPSSAKAVTVSQSCPPA